MKTLLKLAVGAAIAGALVNMLRKERSGRGFQDMGEDAGDSMAASGASGQTGTGTSGYTVEELSGENPAEWGGGSSGLNA